MHTYTPTLVERYLRNYLDIICTLEGNCQRASDPYVYRTPLRQPKTEVPLGKTAKPWPFMEPQHARVPRDGKAKARFLEDLHCAALDIEHAFPQLSDDDQNLLMKYFILQTHTLDDLVKEYNVVSRGSMQMRVFRAVKRLTRILERGT